MSKPTKMFILFSCFLTGVLLLHSPETNFLQFNGCLVKRLLGVECPACGITHSVYETLRLDISQAIKYNAAGPVVTLLLLGNWLYYLGVVLIDRFRLSLKQEKKWIDIGDWTLVSLLLGSWVVKLFIA